MKPQCFADTTAMQPQWLHLNQAKRLILKQMLDENVKMGIIAPHNGEWASPAFLVEKTKKGTYTDGGDDVEITSCYWDHSLSDVLAALRTVGLEVTLFEEYDHSPYPLAGMVERAPGEFVLADRAQQRLPHCYAIRCAKLFS